MSICFNTVAVVFLCELDDNFFAVTIPKDVRERLETTARTLQLSDQEADVLHSSTKVLIISVAIFIPIGLLVWGNGTGTLHLGLALLSSWVAFLPSEIVVILGKSTSAPMLKTIGLVMREIFLSLFMPLHGLQS